MDNYPDTAGLPENARPTFHEIRSLGGHLLEKTGSDTYAVQALMGHSNAEMTEHYLAGYQQKWTPAKAANYDRKTLK
ncbi:tyrosine-type recombinase/integrase [Oceanospirillum sediminis]|uniref:tyrosine-type recombinase/integrase n=1 Tax=Oceanospirillum sediminis TaxID=2760088 RepID=UPI001C72107F|nr:tyrosine-type recombinase/integrase [Oceanospirillum sediminis]